MPRADVYAVGIVTKSTEIASATGAKNRITFSWII